MRSLLLLPFLVLCGPAAFAHGTIDPEHFSCDAPAGAYSAYERPTGQTAVRFSSVVHINQPRTGTKWSPVLNVSLVGTAPGHRVLVRFLPDFQTRRVSVGVKFPEMTRDDVAEITKADLKSNIPVTILVSAKETRVTIGDVSRVGIGLTDERLQMHLSCSSIDAHVDDIVLESGS